MVSDVQSLEGFELGKLCSIARVPPFLTRLVLLDRQECDRAMRGRLRSLHLTGRRNRRVSPVHYSHGKREFANRTSSVAFRQGMLEPAVVHNVRSYTAFRSHFHACVPFNFLGSHAFSVRLHDTCTFRRMDLQGQPGQIVLSIRKPYRMEDLPLFSLSEFAPIDHPTFGLLSSLLSSK